MIGGFVEKKKQIIDNRVELNTTLLYLDMIQN